jgi:cell division protein FtsB
MDFNLKMEKMIANEIIDESKRKGKIYGYLDTIRGAGRHYMNKKSLKGSGQGWSNWITNTNDYDQTMAKRAVDITRNGVTKEEATSPIPDISDIGKLYEINKLFDALKNSIITYNENLKSFKPYFDRLKTYDLDFDFMDDEEKREYTEFKLKYDTYFTNISNVSNIINIVRDWNKLCNYLQQIVNYKKLNKSDQNKITDKFVEIIPIIAELINFMSYFSVSNIEKIKLIYKKAINKDYTQISDKDVLVYYEDYPEEKNPSAVPDASGTTRRRGNPLNGFDEGDEDEFDDDDHDNSSVATDRHREAQEIAENFISNFGIMNTSDNYNYFARNPRLFDNVLQSLVNSGYQDEAQEIFERFKSYIDRNHRVRKPDIQVESQLPTVSETTRQITERPDIKAKTKELANLKNKQTLLEAGITRLSNDAEQLYKEADEEYARTGSIPEEAVQAFRDLNDALQQLRNKNDEINSNIEQVENEIRTSIQNPPSNVQQLLTESRELRQRVQDRLQRVDGLINAFNEEERIEGKGKKKGHPQIRPSKKDVKPKRAIKARNIKSTNLMDFNTNDIFDSMKNFNMPDFKVNLTTDKEDKKREKFFEKNK